jgi:hypothetical protein
MKPGDRVRLTVDLIEVATGDHPDLLVAPRGTVGRLVPRFAQFFAYYVEIQTTARGYPLEVVGVHSHEIQSVEIVPYTPKIVFFEPVDPDYIVARVEHCRRSILRLFNQI